MTEATGRKWIPNQTSILLCLKEEREQRVTKSSPLEIIKAKK